MPVSQNYQPNKYHQYNKYGQSNYSPKAAVKNFTDLEVYQKALEGSVFVASEGMKGRPAADVGKAEIGKSHMSQISKKQETISKKALSSKSQISNPKQAKDSWEFNSDELESTIIKTMCITALSIPHLIAESHSKRFGESTECLKILDEVMLRCNKMVVYLEQARDICQTGIETARFKEEIDKYFYIRRKVLNLQRVWRKYIISNQGQSFPASKKDCP